VGSGVAGRWGGSLPAFTSGKVAWDGDGKLHLPQVMHSRYYINGSFGELEGSITAPMDGPEQFSLTLGMMGGSEDQGGSGFTWLFIGFVVAGGGAAALLILLKRKKG